MNYKSIILYIVAIVILLVPCIIFADVQLEVGFPEFADQALSGESTLPQTIRYVFNLLLILAITIICLSLIYGGFIYLSSTGNPAKTGQARKRIISSIIGLAILLSSFLLLKIIDPDFLIFKINRVPVETGVLFLNEKVFEALNDPTTDIYKAIMGIDEDARREMINKLLNNPIGEPRVMYLGWNMSDLQSKFGEIETDNGNFRTSPIIGPNRLDNRDYEHHLGDAYNFKNFNLKGLFFLPNANKEVFTYYRTDFRTLGLLKKPSSIYTYPDCSALTGEPCEFNLLTGKRDITPALLPDHAWSVPLSIKIKDIGKGVILDSEVDESGYEFAVLDYSSSISDLGTYGFDDEAKRITIKNWDFVHNTDTNKLEGVKIKNYLAVLYEDPFFRKSFRIFFEEHLSSGPPFFGNLLRNNPALFDPNDPNSLERSSIEIKNEPDVFGRVNGASSIKVFEMPNINNEEWDEWEAQGCKIWLCTSFAQGTLKEHFNNCLRLSFPDRYSKQIDSQLFIPFNIPDKKIPAYNAKGTLPNGVDINFKENIHSMRIEGNCMVALFENAIDENECRDCDSYDPSKKSHCEACWDKEKPGEHSEIFSPMDTEYPNYKRLEYEMDIPNWSDPYYHSIGTCGCFEGAVGRTWDVIWGNECRSCVSSMAVFPLKIQY